MRRTAVLGVCLAALAVPGAVSATVGATGGDGSLVVKDASGPRTGNVPVVALIITGAAIGHVDQGRIVIDNGATAEVTQGLGVLWSRDSPISATAQVWGGTDFKFRAVGGTHTILIYGSGIDVVALGTGTVTLTGLVGDPLNDGKYSLNGSKTFLSLPGTTGKQLTIGTAPASSNG